MFKPVIAIEFTHLWRFLSTACTIFVYMHGIRFQNIGCKHTGPIIQACVAQRTVYDTSLIRDKMVSAAIARTRDASQIWSSAEQIPKGAKYCQGIVLEWKPTTKAGKAGPSALSQSTE